MRSFHASIMCLLRSPRATCNYRILFYSVSDYINQRKIINQQGWNSQTVILYWIIRCKFLNNRFKKVSSCIYFDYVMAWASCDFLKYFFGAKQDLFGFIVYKYFTTCKNLML